MKVWEKGRGAHPSELTIFFMRYGLGIKWKLYMKKYIPLSQLYINEVEKQPKNKILKTPKNTILK